jgi:hypothetical protein
MVADGIAHSDVTQKCPDWGSRGNGASHVFLSLYSSSNIVSDALQNRTTVKGWHGMRFAVNLQLWAYFGEMHEGVRGCSRSDTIPFCNTVDWVARIFLF